MERTIIIVSGKAGSGKDTFANMLAAELWNNGPALRKGDGATMYIGDTGNLIFSQVLPKDLQESPEDAGTTQRMDIDLRDTRGLEVVIQYTGIRIMHYAMALKRFCVDALGLEDEWVWGDQKQKDYFTRITRPSWAPSQISEFMSVCEVLQEFGTTVVRALNPDAWVRLLCKRVLETREPFLIIADARFPNELQVNSAMSGYQFVRVRLLRTTRADCHPSETALDAVATDDGKTLTAPAPLCKFDLVLGADASLGDMRHAAMTLAKKLLDAEKIDGE